MTNFSPPAHARWIGSDHPFDLHEVYTCLRAPAFALTRPPASARLFITGDSRYKVWVNGVLVGRGPARSWPHAQQVDAWEIAPHLRAGQNVIAAQIYQPGYSHFAYLHRGAAGLLAWLECDGATALVSDASWRVRRDPTFAPTVDRVSIYGSGVEERTLTKHDDWTEPDYEATAWAAARIVAPAQSPLWSGLRLRATPLLDEQTTFFTDSIRTHPPNPRHPRSILGEGKDHPLPAAPIRPRLAAARVGRSGVPTADPHAWLRAFWGAARSAPAVADADGWFAPRLAEGEAAFWLFDLGQGWTCQGIAGVEGALGGESLLVSYADKLRDGEIVLSDPATYCRVRLTDRTRLRPGSQTVEGFSLRGGRFLLFALSGPTGPDLRVRFGARTAAYPLALHTPLATGDPELDAIVHLCENTLHACLQDTFVDGIWRESSQWLGDALVQALALSSMSSDARPLRAALEMAAQGAYADGVLPSILPGEVHSYCVVDYNFSWVEMLRFYFDQTGDRAFVAGLWPTLVRLLDRFAQDVGDGGLIRSQPGRRLFLDWSPQSRQEPNAVYNLRYLYALQQAIALAQSLGGAEIDSAERWLIRAHALRQAVGGAFWDGEIWWDDGERTTHSQLTAALAVLTGAAQADEWDGLLAQVVARSLAVRRRQTADSGPLTPHDGELLDLDDSHQPGQMVLASPFMHHYIFEALHRAGQDAAVIEIIRRRWGRWAGAGFPTTWENWNVDFPDGSQCHAFSAHPRFHLARSLGRDLLV